MKLAELKPDTRNANKGTDRGRKLVKESLRKYGAGRSILVDKHGNVIAGNKTLEGAKAVGLQDVQIVKSDGSKLVAVQRTDLDINDKAARELAIADNRASEVGLEWDPVVLEALEHEVDVDLSPFWNERELVQFWANAKSDAPEPKIDQAAELQKKWGTKSSQVWVIGQHRILCGDAIISTDVELLMAGKRANLVFTSPPYAEQRDYDEQSGFRPIPPDRYLTWYEPIARHIRENLASDGSYFLNIKPSCSGLDTDLYVFDLVLAHVRAWGFHFATEFCWERTGVPKSVTQRFKNQFEPVYQFALNRWKMRPDAVCHYSDNVPVAGGDGSGQTTRKNVQGGRGASSGSGSFGAAKKRRNGTALLMSDVQGINAAPGEYVGPGLAYPGNRLPTFSSTHEALGHTAAFPVGLPEFFVNAYTDPGDIVFDPFMGSASTIVAAAHQDRIGYGCDISPKYIAVALQRLSDMGLKPKLA